MRTGIKTPRLKCLRPVLKKWIGLNRSLGKSWSAHGDAPWWYNERPLISVFAGAVWLSGGYAFEEYSETKRGKKKKPFPGRIDLEFSTGNQEFRAEVKQCWPHATAQKDQTEYISKAMNKAKTDARRLHPDGMRRLAMVFGSMIIAKHLQPELESRIEWIVDQALQIEADAVAWAFPNLPRYPNEKSRIFPGIIVWIKEVKR